MNCEENRLCTFDDWPQNAPVSVSELAEEGFFATGRFLEVECFSCHCRISSWVYGDKVEERHKNVNANCSFLINRSECNNVPLSQSGPVLDTSNNSLQQSQSSESLYVEANRLATFKNWPNPNISPESLAKAGFYYLNRSDEAKCAWCKGVIAKWEKNDNAFTEHQRFFPHCPRVQLGPLIEMASDGIRDLGIQKIIPPKEPKFSSLDARLRTYEKWPIPTIQDPMSLAQAGLYYENTGDQVRCFQCNIGLRSWQKDDNPWFEHAKWFPECQFVRLVKGSKYVESVLKTAGAKSNPECENPCSSAVPPQNITIEEAMISKPVRQALEMGIDSDSIRNTTQKQLVKNGQMFTSVVELVQAVFDDCQEQNEIHELDEQQQTILNDSNETEGNILSEPSTSSSNRQSSHTILCSTFESGVDASGPNICAESGTEHDEQPIKSSSVITNFKNSELSLEEENRKLKDARLCKVCLDEEVGVVYLPCGHLVTCVQCAPNVTQCPMCRTEIKGYVRTFLS